MLRHVEAAPRSATLITTEDQEEEVDDDDGVQGKSMLRSRAGTTSVEEAFFTHDRMFLHLA